MPPVFDPKSPGRPSPRGLFSPPFDEVRRKQIAADGAERVRRHFRLAPMPQDRAGNIPAICERLDRFYEDVLDAA